MQPSRITRRAFLGSLAATTVGSLSAYVAVSKPSDLVVSRVEAHIASLPTVLDGLTIAQLSDFHYDPYFDCPIILRAVEMANALAPDLIVLTGDYVSVSFGKHYDRRAAANAEPCAGLLAGLRAPLGTTAILGNHDHYSEPNIVAKMLERHGIRVLRNKNTKIEARGTHFWLAGVDDVLGGAADLNSALKSIPAGEVTVLLAHEPDYADHVARHPVHLQLSGHSHGGQIRMPLVGALYLPELGEKYPWGFHTIGSLLLYTNVGVGTLYAAVRINTPPEISLITLRAIPRNS